jgi:KDO2-lipid IV(A) lauroyltransferase
LYFPKINKKLLEKIVSFENTDIIFESLRKGKGLFMLGGHISNWEMQASAFSRVLNARINGVAKPQTNSLVNKKIIEYRELGGSKVIEIGGSLRSIYTLLNKNEIVLFLMDQSANPDYSVYAEFYGYKIATFTGPAKMALKNRTDIVFAYAYRKPDYSYVVRAERLIYDDLTEYSGDNIAELTGRINSMLENVIREYPDQWHWFHRRFKHIKN